MRGRKPNQTKLFPVVAPVVQGKRTEIRARREEYCDRIADTADAVHAMIGTLRQEGGNEALLQRAEFYFQCAFLAAGWSLDLIDGDDIDFIM